MGLEGGNTGTNWSTFPKPGRDVGDKGEHYQRLPETPAGSFNYLDGRPFRHRAEDTSITPSQRLGGDEKFSSRKIGADPSEVAANATGTFC